MPPRSLEKMLELATKARERAFPVLVTTIKRLLKQFHLLVVLATEIPIPTLDVIADENKANPDLLKLIKVIKRNRKLPEKAAKEIRRM